MFRKVNAKTKREEKSDPLPVAQESDDEVPAENSEKVETLCTDEQKDNKPDPSLSKPVSRSPRQQEASRKNGGQSRGPKTERGKSISSQNATKLGIFSNRLKQLNDQNAKDFADISADLQEHYKPVGPIEEFLIQKMAYEALRMGVAAQYFHGAILSMVNGAGAGNLLKYESGFSRQFFQAMRELERVQRQRNDRQVAAPPPNVQFPPDGAPFPDDEGNVTV